MSSCRLPDPLGVHNDSNTTTAGNWGSVGASEVTSFALPALKSWDASPAKFQKIHNFLNPDMSYIFSHCLTPTLGISESDWLSAANKLGVEIKALKAVAAVETGAQGAFDKSGRPAILFERHYFHKLTAGIYSTKNPSISNAVSGGYGLFSIQYAKLEEAYKLNPEAALRSASWGAFQIMGENYHAAGYSSVNSFVADLVKSEVAHLNAVTNFINSNPKMKTALINKNWAGFAEAYNGPGYAKNDYDTKLESAYGKL
jgi:N-acetylmuramidase